MGFFKSLKSTPKAHQKNFLMNAGDSLAYQQGGGNTSSLDYKRYMESIQSVNNAINIISSLASGANFSFKREDAKGKLKALKIKNIDTNMMNDFQSQADFIRKVFAALLTHGAVLIVTEESRAPWRQGMIDFQVVNNTQFNVNIGTNQTIESFTYKTNQGTDLEIKYEDAIYIAVSTDVANAVYGLARLKALNTEVKMALTAQDTAENYLSTGGKKSGIISFEQGINPDSIEEVKRSVNRFINSTQPELLMMSEKLNLDLVNTNASQTEIIETLAWINKTIMEFFNIPQFLIGDHKSGLSDKAIRICSRLFFETQLKPLFNTIESHFTNYFRNTLGINNAKVLFNYDGVGILEDDKTELVEVMSELYKIGVCSANEVRRSFDLEPLDTPNADLRFLPAYLQGSVPQTLENFDPDATLDTTENDVPAGPGGDNNAEGRNGSE